jgi:hypothetical protein
VQIFHDENALRRIRQVLAIFLVPVRQRLINLEVRLEVADLYNAAYSDLMQSSTSATNPSMTTQKSSTFRFTLLM